MSQALTSILWWAAVIAAYYLATSKGRNRPLWVIATALIPLAVLLLAFLPTVHRHPGPNYPMAGTRYDPPTGTDHEVAP